MVLKRKKPITRKVKRTNEVLLLDVVTVINKKESRHRPRLLGPATPALFQMAVIRAFNRTSLDGKANIIYLARMLSGRKPKIIAKLFQAKRDKRGLRLFTMFAAYHHPDGERLRILAKLPKRIDNSTVDYQSRPPFNPDFPPPPFGRN